MTKTQKTEYKAALKTLSEWANTTVKKTRLDHLNQIGDLMAKQLLEQYPNIVSIIAKQK